MTGIVHCGSGNIGSVANAVEYLGGDATIIESPDDLDACERIIFPGVGSFYDVMVRLGQSGFCDALNRNVLEQRKPTLGICLGMQLMATSGMEGGGVNGLGWFESTVERITPASDLERVPHVGWNQIEVHRAHRLLDGIPPGSDFYFVHSFAMRARNAADVVATCDYGGGFVAAVARDNIFAVQFHPEKSQDHGLKIMENFLDWNP